MKMEFNLDQFNTDQLPEMTVNQTGDITMVGFGYHVEEVLRTIDDEEGSAHQETIEQVVCDMVMLEGDLSYGKFVSEAIRSRYTADDIEAITANYILSQDESSEISAEKRSEYTKEYSEYQQWRATVKSIAAAALAELNQ